MSKRKPRTVPYRPVELPMMRWSVNMTERGRLRAMKWCNDHGVQKPGDVVSVEFYQEVPGETKRITAYVRRYVRDEDGKLHVDRFTGAVAEHPVQELDVPFAEYKALVNEWSQPAAQEPGVRWTW